MTTHAVSTRRNRPWTLPRALFALAGTMTLVAVAAAVVVSPWFLLLAAFVGISEWSYAVFGDCPASFALRRLGLAEAAE